MRDAGLDPPRRAVADHARPISHDIPDGAPFASTSRFLNPPASTIPLVLLPVRLETRFQRQRELWLRVYPDDVHVNSFEPELTADESSARTQFLAQAQPVGDAARAAFLALAQQFGAAARRLDREPARAAGREGRAMDARRLHARAAGALDRHRLSGQCRRAGAGRGAADRRPAAGRARAQQAPASTTDDGMRWVTDFDRAIQAGMAFRIPLTPAQTARLQPHRRARARSTIWTPPESVDAAERAAAGASLHRRPGAAAARRADQQHRRREIGA